MSQPPTPDPMEPLRRFLEQTSERSRELLSQMDVTYQRIFEPMNQVRERMREQLMKLPDLDTFSKQIALAGEAARRMVERALPPNWKGLSAEEMRSALELGSSSGINTVWVPRAEVIRALLQAQDHEELEATLLANETDLLVDVEACLKEVDHDRLTSQAELALAALRAHRDHNPPAGQALASAVLSGLVHDEFAFARFADARRAWQEEDPDDVGLSMLRQTIVLHAFAYVLTKTHEAGPGYNRHGSLHSHAGAYTPANALASLLLLAGVLRELDDRFKREDAAQA